MDVPPVSVPQCMKLSKSGSSVGGDDNIRRQKNYFYPLAHGSRRREHRPNERSDFLVYKGEEALICRLVQTSKRREKDIRAREEGVEVFKNIILGIFVFALPWEHKNARLAGVLVFLGGKPSIVENLRVIEQSVRKNLTH